MWSVREWCVGCKGVVFGCEEWCVSVRSGVWGVRGVVCGV